MPPSRNHQSSRIFVSPLPECKVPSPRRMEDKNTDAIDDTMIVCSASEESDSDLVSTAHLFKTVENSYYTKRRYRAILSLVSTMTLFATAVAVISVTIKKMSSNNYSSSSSSYDSNTDGLGFDKDTLAPKLDKDEHEPVDVELYPQDQRHSTGSQLHTNVEFTFTKPPVFGTIHVTTPPALMPGFSRRPTSIIYDPNDEAALDFPSMVPLMTLAPVKKLDGMERPSVSDLTNPPRPPTNVPTIPPKPTFEPITKAPFKPFLDIIQPVAEPSAEPAAVVPEYDDWVFDDDNMDDDIAINVPSVVPTQKETLKPTLQLFPLATREPTSEPVETNVPSYRPTEEPTRQTRQPTKVPTGKPTRRPNQAPITSLLSTDMPTFTPTSTPTTYPTTTPTQFPTLKPITPPTTTPTQLPTLKPIAPPTTTPTLPITPPTTKPTQSLTLQPIALSTPKPTQSSTPKPIPLPTTEMPTPSPTTETPTPSPTTEMPTPSPTTETPTPSPTTETPTADKTTPQPMETDPNPVHEVEIIVADPIDPSIISYRPGDLSNTESGVLLSKGLTAKIIAETGKPVQYSSGSTSSQVFHGRPDAGDTFVDTRPFNKGGWVYVSNSEVRVRDPPGGRFRGGVGAFTFDKNGALLNYEMILTKTTHNCGGGRTPWNTWISCEEATKGVIWQVDPIGEREAQQLTMGSWGGSWESFAYDISDMNAPHFLVTEDHARGAMIRFTPARDAINWAEPWGMLHGNGTTEYLVLTPDDSSGNTGTYKWVLDSNAAENSAAKYYPNAEGIDCDGETVYFVSKKLQALFQMDLRSNRYTKESTVRGLMDGRPDQIARILQRGNGEHHADDILYFCEEGGVDAGVHGRDTNGNFFTILESPVYHDETSGLAFSPDGKHMYVSYQDNGILLDVSRIDGLPFHAKSLNVKYHANPE